MNDADGYLLVHGDFKSDARPGTSDAVSGGMLTAGTMEIKGDLTQASTSEGSYAQYGFNASGTHKVILSGTGEQTVSFEDPGSSGFNILEVKNQTGLVQFKELSVGKEIIGDIISNTDIKIYDPNFELSNQTIKAPNVYLCSSGTIELLDGAKIDSNLIHSYGALYVRGNAEITGDYYITNADKTGYSDGILYMTVSDGYLLVHGDFKIDCCPNSVSGHLNAGTLEIKGDFAQASTNDGSYNSYCFNASGTHKVILSGTGEQIVSFEDPTYSRFNILVNQNSGGVIFKTEYRYNELKTFYTIEFKDADGTVLQSGSYSYGDEVIAPANPNKLADKTYIYNFIGWDKSVSSCTKNTTYTAVYDAIYIYYTVTFRDYDGRVISSEIYHYGDEIMVPVTPTKEADDVYTYNFAGWDNEVTACIDNIIYTATYTPIFIDYTIVFKDYDGKVISSATYHYGDAVTVPVPPVRETDMIGSYIFKAWDSTVVNCAGDATYTATYEAEYIYYSVIFKDAESGEVYKEESLVYGSEIILPEIPTKEGGVFKAWNGYVEDMSVNGNIVFEAVWHMHVSADEVVENNVDPDCLTDGSYDNVVYCSECGVELSREAVTVEKLGHDYSNEWTVDIDPTCITVGSKSHHCSRCDDKVDITEVVALGHSFIDYKTNNDATYTENGTETAKCDRCTATDTITDEGSALGLDQKFKNEMAALSKDANTETAYAELYSVLLTYSTLSDAEKANVATEYAELQKLVDDYNEKAQVANTELADATDIAFAPIATTGFVFLAALWFLLKKKFFI